MNYSSGTNEKTIRLRYIRVLEKFVTRSIGLLKYDNFDIILYKKATLKSYENLVKTKSCELYSQYPIALKNLDSFRETFIVMSVIPFSLLGVLVGHQIMGVNLGMTTMIGALGLAGVVINDGIIMMTYLKKAKTIEDVFIQGAKRFRPIILTSVTTLIGVSTMIFFPTGQAVIFQPLAIALGFGLLWGTVINLIYLPVLYTFANKLK